MELENAISTKDSPAARRQLDSWRWQAGNLKGILTVTDPDESKILRGLQQSVGLARVAGSALFENDNIGTIISDCAKARVTIVTVCDDLNAWLGKTSTEAT